MVDDPADVPLVFVHGLKGSRLVSKSTGKVLWLEASGALRKNDVEAPGLALPLRWSWNADKQLFEQERDDVVADGLISRVAWRSVYGPLIGYMDKYSKATARKFHVFCYDWRRDIWEHIEAFENFLRGLKAPRGAQVIAHSNGGLIAYAVLSRTPFLFHSVCFASVPFRPGTYPLQDLHLGNQVGLNKTLLSPEVVFSFASPWLFFPTDADRVGWIVERDGSPISGCAFDVDTWRKHRLSVFGFLPSDGGQTELEERYTSHLRAALHNGLRFRQTFLCKGLQVQSDPSIPVVILGSKKRSVPIVVVKDGPVAVRGLDFVSAPAVASDGRVPYYAMFPDHRRHLHKVIHSNFDHSSIVSDTDAVRSVIDALFELKKSLLAAPIPPQSPSWASSPMAAAPSAPASSGDADGRGDAAESDLFAETVNSAAE